MRVSFILGSFPRLPVGGYRVVYEYANGLVRRGHSVSLLHCRSPRLAARPSVALRLKSHSAYVGRKLLGLRPGWFRFEPAVKFQVIPDERECFIPDADFVFVTAWHLAPAVLAYPASRGRKAYLFQHYEIWSGPKESVDETWRAPFLKIAVSSWLRKVGMELGSDVVHVVPNGIDHRMFAPKRPLHGRERIVSMMYSAQWWKGGDDGLAALSAAREKVGAFKAVLFGVTRPRRAIPSWAEFVVNPSQERLAGIYSNSAVFLCPSYSEGFALPPAEAMACGAAVATTDCGGNSDFCLPWKTALMSQPGDLDGLARNVAALFSDEALRMRLAEDGLRHIRGFEWSKSIESFEAILEKSRN